jgi:hypothetical protein
MNNKPAMGIMVTLRITSENSYFSDKLKKWNERRHGSADGI